MSDKKQYWINQDGIQQGPLTLEQLELMTIDENAYVWSAGFDDWKPLRSVPELEHLLPAGLSAGQEVADVMIPPLPDETAQPAVPDVDDPHSAIHQTPTAIVTEPSDSSQPTQPYPPCPPTNMVWAIISTILCCIPLGIVAIYYSNKVSKKYYEGDLKSAEHYSEVSAWWCIGTIVGGIIASPFVSLIQMAMIS